ncbi:hypothetical protein H5410_025820 [Solanum commersonii]|uniref:F-box domain-containing protein n=1 Tax=Solanum commersonii TaxID=4109 RepID=A0A9J5YWZ1_SOLCO|nr:hypothetical protein H5410_025820 [Solanum commersonii]
MDLHATFMQVVQQLGEGVEIEEIGNPTTEVITSKQSSTTNHPRVYCVVVQMDLHATFMEDVQQLGESVEIEEISYPTIEVIASKQCSTTNHTRVNIFRVIEYLNLKQRATTCIVSKKWNQMIKSLDDRKFLQIQCASRYSCAKSSRNFVKFHPVVKFATDNTNLTEFYFLVPDSGIFYFSFKKLESRLLTVLHLKCCTINENNFSWFPSMKEICFNRVHINPLTLSNLFVSVLRLLKIRARNLTEFHLFNSSLSVEVDLRACTKLQIMELDCQYIPNGFPKDISSEFLCLKSLSLSLF